jgi:hypothetical protein
LTIVPYNVFIKQRCRYHAENITDFNFSLSLEWAIYAVASDLVNPAAAEALASKAKALLDMEISRGVTSLGSIQAGLLLGWRKGGSENVDHYWTIANDLTLDSGTYIDPSDCTVVDPSDPTSPTQMTGEEVEARRFTCWSYFVFDRYCHFY